MSLSQPVVIGDRVSPAQAMRLAIYEGARGWGRVAPNPLVGCAIVSKSGVLLALGHHRRVGHEHAEIDALQTVSNRSALEGATFYVTLEPCAHQGRVGSCAKALAQLPIAKVVYGVQDPDPRVAGKGASILREAGIAAFELADSKEFTRPEEAAELVLGCEELAEIFLHNQRAQKPFVALKVAATLDGQMAMATGESKWITGAEARTQSHRLRAGHDAVLIGRRTFELDDPRLDVRAPGYDELTPGFAVILDPLGKSIDRLKCSALLAARPAERIIYVTSVGAKDEALAPARDHGAQVLRVRTGLDGAFDARALLATLWDAGVRSILVEGGARAYATFAQPREFQRLHAFIAPTILGGRNGLAWAKDFGSSSLADGMRLMNPRGEMLGADFYMTGTVSLRS